MIYLKLVVALTALVLFALLFFGAEQDTVIYYGSLAGMIVVPTAFLMDMDWKRLFYGQAFGDAQWATRRQMRKAGLFAKGGLFLGRSRGHDLYHKGEGHIMTIGGTGGGKSVGLVVPALLSLSEGSVVVTDPSGELAAMTRRHRATKSTVVLLNPFNEIFEESGGFDFEDTGFNPLTIIDPKRSTFKSDCDVLAQYLMVSDRKESGSYWNDEATELVSLVIAATVLYEKPDLQNLPFIYGRLRQDLDGLLEWFDMVIAKGHPAIEMEAERFAGIADRSPNQWDGIASKAALATKRYAPSTPLGEHVKIDGFNAADLKKKDLTIYILVPSGQLSNALPWMNMLIGVFALAIGRPGAARSVTLLVDEAPALGYIPDLITLMSLYRKAGLRVWLFTQTRAQLAADHLYGENGFKALFGQCTVKQFFALKEQEVLQLVSDMAGQRTADNTTKNERGESVGEVGVPLIRPEKVRGLKQWEQIIVMDKMHNPIKSKLVPFFKRKAWREVTDKNPYREG